MSHKIKKTNAMRVLDTAGIPYTVLSYTVDESDLSGTKAAEALGLPARMVYKTLVFRGKAQPVLVCMIPVAASVDVKKLAALAGEKQVATAHVKELTALTGYVRGGCSPLAMKKNYPLYIDSAVLDETDIVFSAGQRGVQIRTGAAALIELTGAAVGDVTAAGSSPEYGRPG